MGILIVNIFSIIFETLIGSYIILLFYNKLEKQQFNKKQIILLFSGILFRAILCTILKNYIPGINTIISIIIEALLISLVLKLNIFKSLLMIIAKMCIFAITEIIAVYLVMFIFSTTMEGVLSAPSKLLCTTVFHFILITLLITAYHKLTKTKPINLGFFEDINNKQILTLAALLIVYIFPQMLIFIANSYTYPIPLLAINSIQFVLIFIIAFIFVKSRVEHEKTQSELFISELHNKTLVGMVDGVRTMKHDHNNIIQALNGYVLTKQYDALKDHIKVLLKECNSVNNLALIDPKIFNQPAIYGIVGSKYFLAAEKNITFDLDIVTNVATINFPVPDLSRILGILLDNAIEATLKSQDPYIRLEMHYDKRKCADVIKIYNTYDTSINIEIDNIFKKGYSTKEVKSGIGLWEVKKLISKKPHSQIIPAIEGDKFVQTIIIEKSDIESELVQVLEGDN